jgi:hypothetical protein
MREAFPSPSLLADSQKLNRYFWERREGRHALALETETDAPRREWHEEKLSLAGQKLSEGFA